MKKEKKRDKDTKDNEQVEMENYWDVFLRNYRSVPAFKSLVKLSIYILLIIIFVVVAVNAPKNNDSSNSSTTTTKKVVEKNISYLEMLDNILNVDKNINIAINIGDKRVLIEGELASKVMSGYYTSDATTKRFSIDSGKVYELNLDERIENNNLFDGIDLTFIDQSLLIERIKQNPGTKEVLEAETLYSYEITSNNQKYSLKSHVKDNQVNKIEVVGDSIKYDISYK